MSHPEYMGTVDKDFQLPEFLNVTDDKYQGLVTTLRKEHYAVLDTVEDTAIEQGGLVDTSYAEVTDFILTSRDKEENS